MFAVIAGGAFVEGELQQGAQKLKGKDQKVVWAEFSTLGWAVFVTTWYNQTLPHLKLKTRPRFRKFVHDYGHKQLYSTGSRGEET
jgi:hypothetical protein